MPLHAAHGHDDVEASCLGKHSGARVRGLLYDAVVGYSRPHHEAKLFLANMPSVLLSPQSFTLGENEGSCIKDRV
jgi:hypothetical protein